MGGYAPHTPEIQPVDNLLIRQGLGRQPHRELVTMGGYAPHTPEIVVIRFHFWGVRRS